MIGHLLISLHTIIVLYCQLKVAAATVIDTTSYVHTLYVAHNKYMKSLGIIGTLLELYSKLVLP